MEPSAELDEYPELEMDDDAELSEEIDSELPPVSNEIIDDDNIELFDETETEDRLEDTDENDSVESESENVDIDELGDDLAEGVDLGGNDFGEENISNLLSEGSDIDDGFLDDDLINASFDESDIHSLLADDESLIGESVEDEIETSSKTDDVSFEIDELEQADFDQLLAELSDENQQVNEATEAEPEAPNLNEANEQSEISSDNIDDDLLDDLDEDFLSVDNLMDDLDDDDSEIPEDLDIDVGLDDFDELASSRGSVDVDTEAGGMASELDLAKTYIEMDDVENAKLILDKIALSDNKEAKEQALSLLDELNG